MANENLVKSRSWFERFAIAYTLTGGPPVLETETITDGQTIRVGDPVTKPTGTNRVSLATVTSDSFYGVSLGAGVGTAGVVTVVVAVGDRNTVFVARFNAASTDVDDGDEADIVSTGTAWRLEADTTEGHCLVVGHVPGDDITDATYGGRVYFVIKRSQWDLLVAVK